MRVSGSNLGWRLLFERQVHFLFLLEPCICYQCNKYVYTGTLLSPDSERPPSRLLAHSGARYETSDLREIYGAGRRNSAGSSGVLLGRRGGVRAISLDVCAEPSRLEVIRKPKAFLLRVLGPPRTERARGVASVATSGPGKSTVIYFPFGSTRVCISRLVCTE